MKAALLYGLICLIWGSTWMAIKLGLEGVPPFLAAGLRFLFSAAIFYLIILIQKIPIRLGSEDRVCILSSGFFGFTLSYALVYWAEQYISSGLTAILFSTMPLLTAILSRFWMRSEVLGFRTVAGILVGVLGVGVLFWPLAAQPPHSKQFMAMGAILGSSLVSALNLVILKKYSQRTDVFLLNALGMSMGAAALLALSFWTESSHAVIWTTGNLLSLLYLSIFGSVVAFWAYYSLIKIMPATPLSMITLIFPAVAVFLGWIFLGETLSMRSWIGVAAVFGGVALAILPVPRGFTYLSGDRS